MLFTGLDFGFLVFSGDVWYKWGKKGRTIMQHE